MARKQLSGAAKRRLKREREEADGAPPSDDGDQIIDAGHAASTLDRYKALGEPPADPLRVIAWTQQHAAVALHDLATDPNVKPGPKRRGIAELTRAIGMVGAKAHDKSRLADAAAALKKVKKDGEHAEPYAGRGSKPEDH